MSERVAICSNEEGWRYVAVVELFCGARLFVPSLCSPFLMSNIVVSFARLHPLRWSQ